MSSSSWDLRSRQQESRPLDVPEHRCVHIQRSHGERKRTARLACDAMRPRHLPAVKAWLKAQVCNDACGGCKLYVAAVWTLLRSRTLTRRPAFGIGPCFNVQSWRTCILLCVYLIKLVPEEVAFVAVFIELACVAEWPDHAAKLVRRFASTSQNRENLRPLGPSCGSVTVTGPSSLTVRPTKTTSRPDLRLDQQGQATTRRRPVLRTRRRCPARWGSDIHGKRASRRGDMCCKI